MDQINQIEAIKNLINASEQQTKLLKNELERIENNLPKLTVYLGKNNIYAFKTAYSGCYPNNVINLQFLNHNEIRKDLLDVLFGNNTKKDVYKAIYESMAFTTLTGYNTLRLLREIYYVTTNADEKERIKTVYDKVLAKNMYFVDFKDRGNDLTENIVAGIKRFHENVIEGNNLDNKCIKDDLTALTYLIKNKMTYTEVYNKILSHVNRWISNDYACMYSIQ